MLAIEQVQPTIVAQLRGAAGLAGIVIVEDMGSQANESAIAAALETAGVAISVWPPATTSLVQGNAAQINMDVESGVFVELNPERNDPVKRLDGTRSLGNWDADTNTPDISAIEAPEKGDYFTVSVPGETDLAGHADWKVGDVVVFDGEEWKYGAAPKQMFKLVKAAVQAVLAYRGTVNNPNDLFALADQEPITLDTFDPGLYRYHIVFSKRCVL